MGNISSKLVGQRYIPPLELISQFGMKNLFSTNPSQVVIPNESCLPPTSNNICAMGSKHSRWFIAVLLVIHPIHSGNDYKGYIKPDEHELMNIDLLVLNVRNFREWSTFINYQKSSQQPPATHPATLRKTHQWWPSPLWLVQLNHGPVSQWGSRQSMTWRVG